MKKAILGGKHKHLHLEAQGGISLNKGKGGAGWGVTEAGSLLVGQGSGLVFVAS